MARKQKARVDGKCRVATIALMDAVRAKGTSDAPDSPTVVLASCRCPISYWVTKASLRKRCFVCHAWRKEVS